MKRGLTILIVLGAIASLRAETINHAGRILGALPVVTNALLFNTTNADAVLAAMQEEFRWPVEEFKVSLFAQELALIKSWSNSARFESKRPWRQASCLP
jgi:hypothetical protein